MIPGDVSSQVSTIGVSPAVQETLPPRGLRPTRFWGIGEGISPRLQWSLITLSLVLPVLLWWLVSLSGVVDRVFLPTPGDVIVAGYHLWAKGVLLPDIAASMLRVGAGFLLAAIIAVPLGIMMGSFATVRSLLEPITALVRYMPAPAFIALLILYFGIGEASKIMLIFIGTFFYHLLMIMDAVKFVPKELIETTYTLGGNRAQVLWRVIVPYVIPSMLDTFRINMAASWNLVIVAELIAAEIGLGKRILIAQKFLHTDEIFAVLIILGIIGLALDFAFRWLLYTTCRWALD